MAFGVSTKLACLSQSLSRFQHWLPSTSSQLHVSIRGSNWPSISSECLDVETSYRQAAINLKIHIDNKPFAKAYFNLIKTLYDTETQHTKWLVLIDDDTFVPSFSHLVNTWRAIMTRPERSYNGKTEGDQIVYDCLKGHSAIRPAFDRGLQQMGPRGDDSGYLESGRRMLTIHHWKSWYNFDIPTAATVTRACGVVKYPHGLEGLPLDEVERAWEGDSKLFIGHISPCAIY
ncbi:hypothetical protein B2J93_9519 [Marssonina coronariae]|uniref:Glycosyltransferase family 31 protein n=1 Tax=Diplocarpon coronariae TaxID=2795749 RepID=A0A218ZFQ9_9HELO|nr:hypothetical protein B2J93_9519 [Marssonina coronariae]